MDLESVGEMEQEEYLSGKESTILKTKQKTRFVFS